MKSLSRIETAVFLRRLEPFAYCTADQVLRIAAIASEQRYGAGETIYQPKDAADAIYCLIKGKVRLERPDGGNAELLAPSSFGWRDILSGRLRGASAAAVTDCSVLTIQAEDFFDLLSDNVEIVKALFRLLTQRMQKPSEPLAGAAGDEASLPAP